jgi:TonB family protein
MRALLVATLAFAPVLAHAQSAQLQAKLTSPSFENAAAASAVVTTPRRVSTGVVEPKVAITNSVIVPKSFWAETYAHEDAKVTVAMTVDEKGTPSDLKVIASANPELDKSVVEAVKSYRFIPGTVNNTPAAFPVNLTVVVRNPNNL